MSVKSPKFLPELSCQLQPYTDAAKKHIVQYIKAHGAIRFDKYMELALYAPEIGYYCNPMPKFGAAGDFTTAPEISALFAKCVAKQCQQVNSRLVGGEILEIGAGSGVLAKQILEYLAEQDQLPATYYIYEISETLRLRQQELFSTVPELALRVQWLTKLPTLFTGVILANELIDAMPVHRFKMQGELKEYFVDWVNDQFVWRLQPASKNLRKIFKMLNITFADGYASEANSMLHTWFSNLAASLTAGMILFIDYGFPEHEYYHHDRHMGTLMCHFQHYAHGEPLIYPGVQDITAHVNFTQIAQLAMQNNLTISGYTHQAGFLLNCGITEFMTSSTIKQQYQLNQQIKQLTLPSEMGELFKVIALTRDCGEDFIGFKSFDLRNKLFS